jgi:hypothetical protein
MSKDFAIHSLRKLMIASVALAGLGSAAVFFSSGPAEAKAKTCVQKYRDCNSRCARRYDEFQFCIYRTCNPQFDICDGKRFSAAKPMMSKKASVPNMPKPSDKPRKGSPSHTEQPNKNGGFGQNGEFGQRGPMFMSRSRR